MTWRCGTCNGAIGPEDAVGDVTQPGLCRTCRERAERRAAKNHPAAVAGRRLKALAMVEVIDANFVWQFPERDALSRQGAKQILEASFTWSDKRWADIGASALKPNGAHYERKEISDDTRECVREVYEGRMAAPARRAS